MFLAPLALAYAHRLSSEQVREAYYIGRDVERRREFFRAYIHHVTPTSTGPDIQLIEIRTPYEQVALRSQEKWANYDPLDAEKDYLADPDHLIVRVSICATQTFSFAAPPDAAPGKTVSWREEDYLRGFEFRVLQDHQIEPKTFTVKRAQMDCSEFSGFDVFLQFGTQQFAPGMATIEARAPDGHVFQTTFDLDAIK